MGSSLRGSLYRMRTKIIASFFAAAALTACVTAPLPPRRAARALPAPAPAPAPVNPVKVYFYPTQGQSEEQQDRDRYDCHVWAVKQTGFDPSQHITPREERATVVPARSPGETVGTAAVVGAVIGAAIAGPGNAGRGAVVGAMVGTAAGSAAAADDQAAANAANTASARRHARGAGRYEQEAADYRRAMSACLTGRGYSVR
jgi:hypothetical protein